MATPIIHGPDYSTYARTVRLALEEKGAAYEMRPIHILGGESPASNVQPFGKVPGFEHDGFFIYETSAIVRYVDHVFSGKPLQPSDPKQAARMNQVIGIIDSYGYGSILGNVVWQRLIVPMTGGQADDAVVTAAKPMVEKVLSELERIKGSDRFLAGPDLSLADLFLAPISAYFCVTEDSKELLSTRTSLRDWWDGMSSRGSLKKTQPNLG